MSRAGNILGRVNYPGLATMAVLAGLWELLVQWGTLDYDFLPPPSAVVGRAVSLVRSGDMTADVLHTLKVTLLGWLLAALAGVGLGLLLGLSRTAWRYSMASIEVMRAIPPVCLVPLALLVFGFSVRMELSVIFFVSAWPVLLNSIDGVRGVRAELSDVASMLRMSTLTRIGKIVLPAAMPSIIVGLRLALSLSLVLAVIAEMLGNPNGLGHAVVSSQQALQPEEMFVYVLAIGLLGIGLNAIFGSASARLMPPVAARSTQP